MEQQASSNGSMNIDPQNTNNNNSPLIERDEIDNTPFEVVGNSELGYFIALGMYRLTEPFYNKLSASTILAEQQWNIILNIVGIMFDKLSQEEKSE